MAMDVYVSIRAPALGATGAGLCGLTALEGFNPRPRTGGDPLAIWAFDGRRKFQSAPPHWGRLARDISVNRVVSVSIRAPALGATADLDGCADLGQVSIRAPALGATPPDCACVLRGWFQSAPPHWGRLHNHYKRLAHGGGFNPRPRTGGDRDYDKQLSNSAKEARLREPRQNASKAGGAGMI